MRFVYASGSDLIESRKTHATGKRITRHVVTRMTCFAIDGSLLLRARRGSAFVRADSTGRSARTASVTVAEEVEEPDDDGDHRERTDPADGGGEALWPVADLERVVPHVDSPRVRGPVAVEAAHDDVLVDQGERAAEAQHDEHEQDRPQARERDRPERAPLARPVDARPLVELLRDRGEAREVEHRVEAEPP